MKDLSLTNTEQVAVQNFDQISNDIKEFEAKDNELYKCKLCFFPANSQESFKLHMKWRHQEGLEYECNICSQVLATDYALNKHKNRIHGYDEIQEPLEKKRKRTTDIDFERTTDKKQKEREVEGPLVKEDNNTLDDVDPMMNNDSDSQKVKLQEEVSDKINVSSKEEAQLRTAELIKAVHGGYMCTKCGHISRQKFSVEIHIETHFEGLKLPCKFCDKVFTTRANLANHKSYRHRGL